MTPIFFILWPVHGFQQPSYTVNEGENIDITFQRNVKGNTRFPRLQLIGAVMSRGDPAGRLLTILTHTHTHTHTHTQIQHRNKILLIRLQASLRDGY